MKRWILILLLLLSTGCGSGRSAAQTAERPFTSETSAEDCCLCGNGLERLEPFFRGQNNAALISLNTFEIQPIEINRYSPDGQPIEEYAGTVSFGSGGADGGFSAVLMLDSDRGYALGTVDLLEDEALDTDRVSAFLCADCMNRILPREPDQSLGLGVIHLETRELRVLEQGLEGFGLGDFYVSWHLEEGRFRGSPQIRFLIFWCPVRYEKSP